jgi:ATP-binding cassette subfamily G (WHITE) protein 2 (PDR)
MAPAAVVILALIIYTGFAIPITNMHPWFRWINYLDPVSYAFEALMINEVCEESTTLRDFSLTKSVP